MSYNMESKKMEYELEDYYMGGDLSESEQAELICELYELEDGYHLMDRLSSLVYTVREQYVFGGQTLLMDQALLDAITMLSGGLAMLDDRERHLFYDLCPSYGLLLDGLRADPALVHRDYQVLRELLDHPDVYRTVVYELEAITKARVHQYELTVRLKERAEEQAREQAIRERDEARAKALTCPRCGKVCKSESGHTQHLNYCRDKLYAELGVEDGVLMPDVREVYLSGSMGYLWAPGMRSYQIVGHQDGVEVYGYKAGYYTARRSEELRAQGVL